MLADNVFERLRVLEAIVGHAKDAVVLLDFDEHGEGRIVFVNPAFTDQTGYAAEEVVGQHPRVLVRPDTDLEQQKRLREATLGRHAVVVELTHYRKDGSTFVVENHVNPVVDEHGNCQYIVSIQRDVTERKRAEEGLRRADRRFRRIIDHASDSVMLLSPDNRVVYASEAAVAMLGRVPDEDPYSILEQVAEQDRARVADAFASCLTAPGSTEPIAFDLLSADGSWRHVESVANNLIDDPAVEAIVIITRDITDRKLFEEELAYRAVHDSLTGLPNRNFLAEALDHALAERRPDEHVGLLLIDLDRFKAVNDTLGHDAGDRVLRAVAQRLQGAVRSTDTVARLGGDEFAFVLPALATPDEAELVAINILNALRRPFEAGAMRVPVDASVGIALAPDHGVDGEILLQRADVAMYRAKQNVVSYAVYSDRSDEDRLSGLALMVELRRAIETGQLVVHYQPVVDLSTGAIVSVEALARWQHPTRGLISPAEFIPVAEESGLIRPLTDYVLRVALRQLSAWRRGGWDIGLAVNLSARLVDDAELPRRVLDSLRAAGVEPSALELEITESAVMLNPEGALAVFTELTDLDVRLSIDDFGTGFSSLAYLKRLPATRMKVDKSFVLDMLRYDKDASIVNAVIDLGHNLGLAVVAEGVEDAETADALMHAGCDFAQGFYFGRPVAPDALEFAASA